MTDTKKIQELVEAAVKKEVESLRGQIEKLKTDNTELRQRVLELEKATDENEQYSRKSSLILSGGPIPPPPTDREETDSDIRSTVKTVIEQQLKVKLKGGLTACHRLRNKKRILVKFHDYGDRENVYQARFSQMGTEKGKNIIVHENLTQKRAAQVRVLGKLRNDQVISNYYTRNGNIYARIAQDKVYTKIDPTFTEEEIITTLESADPVQHNKTGQGRANKTHSTRVTHQLTRTTPPSEQEPSYGAPTTRSQAKASTSTTTT